MRYQAILFDMDGTLVPMEMGPFIERYFELLTVKLSPLGMDPALLKAAVWKGTGDMMRNDGSVPNHLRFWERFEAMTQIPRSTADPLCLDFYEKDFNAARVLTGENPLAREAVRIARDKAERVVLATNPVFPLSGQATRLRWVGLEPDAFDLVTAYETDRFCKPDPAYFTDVCARIGADPEACLMIGNDERDDMLAASSVGMDCYLVTDTLVKRPETPWNGRRGSFAELIGFLKEL